MKVDGRYRLPFSRSEVWEALMDPVLLSRTLPGCERLTETGEGTFEGTMRVQVGPVRGVFKGRLGLADLRPPEGYHMTLDGQGPTGFMKGEGTVTLDVETDDSTVLAYDLDFQVGGRVAGVGQRVLAASSRAVANQGLEGLERELRARHAPEESAPEDDIETPRSGRDTRAPSRGSGTRRTDPTTAPSQGELAVRIARDVVTDVVPPQARAWVVGAALVLLGFLLGRLGGRDG